MQIIIASDKVCTLILLSRALPVFDKILKRKGKKRCTEARARVTLEVPDDEEGTWGFFPLPSRFFALHGLLRLPSQGGRLTLR